ncbi:hypothetical protein HDU97_005276, partial [Phlyctochytrium planicorne]
MAAAGLEDDLVDGNVTATACFSDPNQSDIGYLDEVKEFNARKRVIVAEQNAWDSSRLAMNVLLPILTELMGYRVLVKEYGGGATTGPRLEAQIVDFAVDIGLLMQV